MEDTKFIKIIVIMLLIALIIISVAFITILDQNNQIKFKIDNITNTIDSTMIIKVDSMYQKINSDVYRDSILYEHYKHCSFISRELVEKSEQGYLVSYKNLLK